MGDDSLNFFKSIPYDSAADPALDPVILKSISSLYGGSGTIGDVLDIGCGSGALLWAVRDHATSLTGVEFEPNLANIARKQLSQCDIRSSIAEQNVFDVNDDALGRFDAIFAIGFLYCTPQDSAERALEIISHCLNPGGMAVLGHYCGMTATINEWLFSTIRTIVDDLEEFDSIKAKILRVRELLEKFKTDAQSASLSNALYLKTLDLTINKPDELIYHEVLNPNWRAIAIAQLERKLRPYAIDYACPLNFCYEEQYCRIMNSSHKAALTDITDLNFGEHRYSVFIKRTELKNPYFDMLNPTLHWRTTAKRSDAPLTYRHNNEILDFRSLELAQIGGFLGAVLDQDSEIIHKILTENFNDADFISKILNLIKNKIAYISLE